MSSASGLPSTLPAPVGRIGPRGWIALVGLSLLFVAGLWARYLQGTEGLIVTNMRTPGLGGAAWGLYICLDVYFVGLSFAGITVAALVRLVELEVLRPLTRIAELLTIVCLLVSALFVLSDLGRPAIGLLYLPSFARPLSPFFGSFTLVVSGYLFASLVFFYLSGRADAAVARRIGPRLLRPWYWLWATGWKGTSAERERHSRVSFWLALFILPLLVIAHSTLGFIFGIQGGRPGWFSALQAPGFVVLAGCSGIGALIVISAGIRRGLGLEDVITEAAFSLLGKFLAVLTLAYLYFMVVEELTASYAASLAETELAHQLTLGHYSPIFWTTVSTMVASFVLSAHQGLRKRPSIAVLVVSGLLINVAALLKRFLIVVPSQTHGALLPYEHGAYVPSVVEIGVMVGGSALAALMYLAFIYSFPIIPMRAAIRSQAAVERPGRRLVRKVAFGTVLLGGFAFAVVGFLSSARVGTQPYADPIVPWSPVLFIIGVMSICYAAAVYETFPATRTANDEPAPTS